MIQEVEILTVVFKFQAKETKISKITKSMKKVVKKAVYQLYTLNKPNKMLSNAKVFLQMPIKFSV